MSVTNNAINAPKPFAASIGGTGTASPTQYAVPYANGASPYRFQTLSNGQLLIGATGGAPLAAHLTPGSNITITNTANGIRIDSTATPGLTWVDQTTSTVTITPDYGYLIDNGADLVTLTLPASAPFGSVFQINGYSAGGWKVVQGTNQQIIFGIQSTTVTSGYVQSSNATDSIQCVCIVEDLIFQIVSCQGTINGA